MCCFCWRKTADEVRISDWSSDECSSDLIAPDLFYRIARGAEPVRERPGALLLPGLDRLRRERGPFASDDGLLLAAFYNPPEYDALKAAGPIRTDYPLASSPLVTLMKEIAARPQDRQSVV